MGRAGRQLPPSEALPSIGDHGVVFHNGKGFYYVCKQYSSDLDKRLFECVKPECCVTASMGPGRGSPLIDNGTHSHIPDPTFRDKCLLLHNIRHQFTMQEVPASVVLQEALASLEDTKDLLPNSNVECIYNSTTEMYVDSQASEDEEGTEASSSQSRSSVAKIKAESDKDYSPCVSPKKKKTVATKVPKLCSRKPKVDPGPTLEQCEEDEGDIEFILPRTGKHQSVIYKGYKYNFKHHNKNDVRFWKCVSLACPGFIKVSKDSKVLSKMNHSLNCVGVDLDKLEVNKCIVALKLRAQHELAFKPINKLVEETLSELEQKGLDPATFPTKKSITLVLTRIRDKIPGIPHSKKRYPHLELEKVKNQEFFVIEGGNSSHAMRESVITCDSSEFQHPGTSENMVDQQSTN